MAKRTRVRKKSDRVLRSSLHKAYIKLLEKTFSFLKVYYIKDRDINPKRDPEIFGSLVRECSLTELKKKSNFLKKLFLKLQQCEFYEDYILASELIQVLFLPSFHKMEYYILLQHHMLENGAVLQIELKDYFNYVHNEFYEYIKNVGETYKLVKLNNFKFLNNNIKLTNPRVKDFLKKRRLKMTYQEIQGIKHQCVAIQMKLLEAISLVETKKHIRYFCKKLDTFICWPDELFCNYR
jgi:hypothetical protein